MTDSRVTLTLGHSPDPDDAFMWWPLFEEGAHPAPLSDPRLRFTQVAADIEALNRRAAGPAPELLDITAMSCANYPLVAERYILTACGASVGDGYGPKLVATEGVSLEQLASGSKSIAIPGRRTTAFLVTSLLLGPAIRCEEVPFDEIEDAVRGGRFDAGVVIHEGQLTFSQKGLRLLEDLGRWWLSETGLPLPLGVNAIRRDLDQRHGAGTCVRVLSLLRRSLDYALAHRRESLEYALRFARGMAARTADEFVSMYVNSWTLDFGARGLAAVAGLYQRAAAAGLLPEVDMGTALAKELPV